MNEQQSALKEVFFNWKGDKIQPDDVIIFSFKV